MQSNIDRANTCSTASTIFWPAMEEGTFRSFLLASSSTCDGTYLLEGFLLRHSMQVHIRLHGPLSESNQAPRPEPDDAVATVASSLEGSRPPRINLPPQEPGTRRLIELLRRR